MLICIIYYCVHCLRIESFRVHCTNRKHCLESDLTMFGSFHSDAVMCKFCQILNWGKKHINRDKL